MQSLLLRYSFVTGPAIDQSQDLVIMTRSQLLENGMLLQRVGHLSSFHPSAGDLTSYLVLNIMREVVCGPSIKHLLDLNVQDATDDINSGVPPTQNKKPRLNNTLSNKQKNALKALEGFLSTDTAGDAASRLRNSSSINDKDAEVDDDDSQQDDQIKSNGKRGRKKKGEAKSQNKGQAKVKAFTGAKIHTPAVEKKNVIRGGGKKEDKPKSAKKTIEAVNPQPPTTTAADLVAIAETKKMLEEIRKATQEQKRANEEILRNSKALQQQREGKKLVVSL